MPPGLVFFVSDFMQQEPFKAFGADFFKMSQKCEMALVSACLSTFLGSINRGSAAG